MRPFDGQADSAFVTRRARLWRKAGGQTGHPARRWSAQSGWQHDDVDLAVAGSFPASDPPAWTATGAGAPQSKARDAGRVKTRTVREAEAAPPREVSATRQPSPARASDASSDAALPTRTGIARIYRPARSASQAGRAGAKTWVLEFAPRFAPELDALMGWTSGCDTLRQVRLKFPDKARAVAFAEQQGWPYTVIDPPKRKRPTQRYADNFLLPPAGRRPRDPGSLKPATGFNGSAAAPRQGAMSLRTLFPCECQEENKT